jgi:YfiH family protein
VISGPRLSGGFWVWESATPQARALFVGRGPRLGRMETLAAVDREGPPVAWARQVHGSDVALPDAPGECGAADALLARRPGLAVAVATADCVPILIGGPEEVAAVHAGWRGIVSGVVGETVRRMGTEPGELEAWIGPAIGACCYEVGEDVAAEVVAASGPEAVAPGRRGRPHLDLSAAGRRQLEAAGVGGVHLVVACSACDERLWSYRRDGAGVGRNLAFVWRPA